MAGVDLPTVREILRHKSYEMTLRYSHLSKDHKKTAMNKLAGALNAKPEDAELTA